VRQEKFLNARYVPVVDAFTNAAVQTLYATNFQICIIKGYFGLAALDQHEALMRQTLQTPPGRADCAVSQWGYSDIL
jgi:hypothetical protein